MMTITKTVTKSAIPGAVMSALPLLITFTVEESFVVEGVVEGVWWPFSLIGWLVGWPLVVCSILSLFDSIDLVGGNPFASVPLFASIAFVGLFGGNVLGDVGIGSLRVHGIHVWQNSSVTALADCRPHDWSQISRLRLVLHSLINRS